MPVPLDLDTYAAQAERFVSEADREYYLHFAGHKEKFEIEPIYERHSSLFEREVIDELRELWQRSSPGDDRRRRRYLLQFAVEGFIGQATKATVAALAEREAALEVTVDGRREPYRRAAIVQANEPDRHRRARIEEARLRALAAELNPLYAAVTEQAHELSVELGWSSYRSMYEELKGVDLGGLERQTRAFVNATADRYRDLVEPQMRAEVGVGFDRLRRSDLSYFFRARSHDHLFAPERLIDSLVTTLAGLGIDIRAQGGVTLDTEQRPTKSPRAFCSPVRVPGEVYLVTPRFGGRDDYAALFHEGGHSEHYASVDPGLPFEFRHLGDNSLTEGFAFLLEHLIEDPRWLRLTLGARGVDDYLRYTRANKFIFLRRYAAKLAYELELHGGERALAEMPALYARCLSEAVGVEWSEATYLSDVDDGYYVANYLRGWAFEARLRRALVERFGPDWFARREAGDFLRSLWREGQRLSADQLLAELTAEKIDFAVMAGEVGERLVAG